MIWKFTKLQREEDDCKCKSPIANENATETKLNNEKTTGPWTV